MANRNEIDTSKLEQLIQYAPIDELAESGFLGEQVAQTYKSVDKITRRKFVAGLSALFFSALEEACSKNNNPLAPCTSDCGNPGGAGNAILTGRAVSVNNPNQGYDSGTAQAGNSMGNLTPGGNYRIENVNAGTMDVSFNGPEFITRKARANAQPGLNQFPPIDAIDKVIDGIEFDLKSFDEMCRLNSGGPRYSGALKGTSIWPYVPEILVDAESRSKMEFPGVYPGMMGAIRKYAAEFMSRITDNKLVGAVVREIPRTVDVPKAPAEGKIIARFGTRQDADGGAGMANFWVNANNNIYAAEVVLTSDISDSGIYHELTHAIGFFGHPSRDGDYTIMSRHHGFEPTPWDFAHGKVLYRIKPGSRTPYDTSHLETLTGNVVAINEFAANKYVQLLKNIGLLPRNLGNRDLRGYRAA